jgi:hypothetical protein
LALISIAIGLYWGPVIAPPDAYQGEVQRIMYLHLPSILAAYLSYFLVFIGSCMYLWKRERRDDILAHSAAGNRRPVYRADDYRRLDLGAADLGCMVDMGCSADAHRDSVVDLHWLFDAALADRE